MTDYETTLSGLKAYYAHRTVFGRYEEPSVHQLTQAIGECQTMIGQLIRLGEELSRRAEPQR